MQQDAVERSVATQSARARFALVTALSLALLAAASGYLFLPTAAAAVVVLACLGVLSTVGVVALFAAAAGVLSLKSQPGPPAISGDPAQSFVENMMEGVLMTGADGTPLSGNAAFLKLSGALNERDLRSIERLFSGNPDAAEAVHRLAVAADRGRRAAEEIRMPGGLDGAASGARWYRVRVNPVGGAQARIGWLVADITREREHQENIFQELQNAIDYLDHAPAGFFSLEPDGRIRYLNATLAEWIGIDLAEFEPGAANIRDIVTVEGLSVIQSASPAPMQAKTLDVDFVAPTERDCRCVSSIASRSAPTARSAHRARWRSI
jgi:two-component system cell cycle sensor histidine kinase/response regulator CckA